MKLSLFPLTRRLLRRAIQHRLMRLAVAEIEAVDSRRVTWADRKLKARTLILWRRER